MHRLLISLIPIPPLSASAALSLSKRNNITSVYTTTGPISVYLTNGTRVGCLDVFGRAVSSLSTSNAICTAFISVKTEGFVAIMPTWFTPTVNYTLGTSQGFCGVTLHNGDAYAQGLNQGYGHVWECRPDMPLFEEPGLGYANVECSDGVNALVDKEIVGSGYAGFNICWNTVGGVALNSTPGVMQARLPDYPLGSDFVFVPEFQPD